MIDFSELPENCASTTLGFGHFAIELPKRKRNTAHLIEKYLVHRDSCKYAYSNHRIPDCLSEATVSIYLSQNPRSFYTYHRIPKVYPAEKQHVPKKLMVGSDVISFQNGPFSGNIFNFGRAYVRLLSNTAICRFVFSLQAVAFLEYNS